MGNEKVEEKIPWIPIIVVILIFSFFGPVWTSMLPFGGSNFYSFTRDECYSYLIVGAYTLILIASMLTVFGPLKSKITPVTLTYLFAIGATACYIGGVDAFPLVDWYVPMLQDRLIYPDLSELYWPWFWAPSADVIKQMNIGGGPVPWGLWLPNIIWWGSLYASFAVFTISIANIFRRAWIDIERVPFPQTLIAYEFIVRSSPITQTKSILERFGKPFIVGLLLGIVLQFPLFMIFSFPWFPDIYGWRTNTCPGGWYYITPDSPLASIIGLCTFQKNPMYMALFYLVPLSISFNVWFWQIVMVILDQVAYMMGYYTGVTQLGGCGRTWCGLETLTTGNPFKWAVVSNYGAAPALVAMYLFLNRRYIWETIKAAFGKLSSQRIEEIEKDEPMSYRTAYIMLIASFIIIVVLWMLCNVSLIPSILIVVAFFFWQLSTARVYGLTGYGVPLNGWGGLPLMWAYFGQSVPEKITREWMIAVNMTRYPVAGQGIYKGFGTGFQGGFSSYTLAKLTGVSAKAVFKVVLVTAILTPFLGNIGFIWVCHTFGRSKLPTPSVWGGSYIDGWANPQSAVEGGTGQGSWIGQALAGALVTVVLSYLHARFIWFPLEPIGFLIATDYCGMLSGIWTAFLIAWVAKILTLRIGGSRAYENYGIPIATGFIFGIVLIKLIGGAMLVLRFFYPW